MTKKRAAVIGYGGMGAWHGRYLAASDVFELAGIYDPNKKRQELARENNIFVYSSFEDVLNDKELDFITIATPNETHKPLAIAAMAAGKHVVCEKPVALSTGEVADIFAAAKKYDKVFTVHQNRRWDADFRLIKKVFSNDDLGEVFNIESRVQGSRGIPGDWRGKKEHGGGMLLDWGVHLIDQILQIIKLPIERLYCRFDNVTNYEVDDGFKLDLMFKGEISARIEVGTSNFISLPRFYMLGTNGTAMIKNWKDNCEIVCCTGYDEGDVTPVVTAAGLTKTMAPRNKESVKKYEIEPSEPDVHDFYRNFSAVLKGEQELIVKHDEIMRVMKVIEAAFESNRLGQVIDSHE